MEPTISLLLKNTIDLLFFSEHKLYGFPQRHVKLNNQNILLKIQHKSLKINGKPKNIYPNNYPTLTKQFKFTFYNKASTNRGFFTKFLFQCVYKRNTRLRLLKFNFKPNPLSGSHLLTANNVTFSFSQTCFSLLHLFKQQKRNAEVYKSYYRKYLKKNHIT